MTPTEKINAIRCSPLAAKLQPGHLQLLEWGARGQLLEDGLQSLDSLYTRIQEGTYDPKWFWDIEHLTKDHQGYVYWKNKRVEHYSFSDEDWRSEREAARKLAHQCKQLEANGFPINGRTAIAANCYDAPPGCPWITAICRYYYFYKEGEQVVGIFYRHTTRPGEPEVVAAYKFRGVTQLAFYPDAYTAFHAAAQIEEYSKLDIPVTYEQTVALLTATGLTGAELERIINAPI